MAKTPMTTPVPAPKPVTVIASPADPLANVMPGKWPGLVK